MSDTATHSAAARKAWRVRKTMAVSRGVSPESPAPSPPPFWTPERVETLKALHADGLSASNIANEIGCSRSAVIGKLFRLKLPSTRLKRFVNASAAQKKRAEREQRYRGLAAHIVERASSPVEFTEAPPSIDDLAIPERQRVRSVLELEHHHCRFPVGTPGTPEAFFCGGEAIAGRPYCAAHWLRCIGCAA